MYEYPFGNGQQLNLDWFLAEWKNLLAAWEAEKNGIEGALQAEIDRAEAALADVFTARDAAAQSATAAGDSASAAAQSASDASGYLATVHADANTASNAAQNAAQSESNAAESAQTAVASKNAAGQSERNAAQSEANANSSKNAAAQSAADALAHKDAAAQSAADADASKSAAAQSAAAAEAVKESIPQDYSDLSAEVDELQETVGSNTEIENVYNVNTDHIYAADTRTPISADIGDEIIFFVTSTSNTGMAFCYIYNRDETTTNITGGDLPLERRITIEKIPVSAAVYVRDLTYPCTVTFKITINGNKISRTQAIIAKVNETMTADTALVANDFRIINNTLYRITAPIAAGATLIPNTNCESTTVGEILKTLLS